MGKRILFLDDFHVAESRGLRRTFHAARKCEDNPVLRPTEPWEERRCYVFGSVLRQGGRFRMWYQTCSNELDGPDKSVVCLAESDDLVSWRKPALGALPFRGVGGTNIVLKCIGPKPLYTPSVVRDETEADPARRYKMLVWDGDEAASGRGGCVAFSPDGVRWIRHGAAPRFSEPNDVLIACADSDGGYVCLQALLRRDRSQDWPRDNLRGWMRIIGRRTSPDFQRWSPARAVLAPGDDDPPDLQFYGMGVLRHPDVWIGQLWTYHARTQTSDVALAWSRDGLHWKRPPAEEKLIELGPGGDFDSHLIYTASSPVEHADTVNIFYGGFDGPHDSYTRAAAIGLATIRADGWCSLDAGGDGFLRTTALDEPCNRIELNISAGGRDWLCRAELVGEGGRPLDGFAFSDCRLGQEAVSDGIKVPLRWRGGAFPRPLRGPWALQLRMRKTSLFAVRLA